MSRKLLVIDDQDNIARLVSRTATDLGFDVRMLTNPEDAFDAFEEFRPDVLLIDLVMPEVDGIDILHRILAMGTEAEIIVMSGFGQGYLRLGLEVAGHHDHPKVTTLAKPFRRADLADVLRRHIREPEPQV